MNPINPLAALQDPDEALPVVTGNGKLVVHGNALSLARYKFTTHAQKLLFLLIANLDQRDHLKVQVHIGQFADTLGYQHNDITFDKYLETAKELMGKYVIVKRAPIPGEKKPRHLVSHWISNHEVNPNNKTITFSFDQDLKPYLLRLKQNFVSYPYIYIVNLATSYAMRLYDALKAFQYRQKPQEFLVTELREILGTTDFDANGKPFNETLIRYFDFKKTAILPAINEINTKSDMLISFRELKKPGTKMVEKLVFDLRHKEGPGTYELITLPREPQIDLPLLGVGDDPQTNPRLIDFDQVRSEFSLNGPQLKKIAEYAETHGESYVLEKISYTRQQKEKQRCENPTAFLLAALRDDYKLSASSPKPINRSKKNKSKNPEPPPAPVSDEEWERQKKLAKGMKQQLLHHSQPPNLSLKA